jgi:predicted AAA+ superfamily ATPase
MNRDKLEYQKPGRTFENSGTVNPRLSYYVPLENVTNTKNQDMKTMVDLGRYFSIFAPRQSGKTTFLKRIRSQLHGDPTYVVIMLSFQKYKKLDKRQFYAQIEKNLYTQLPDRLKEVKCDRTDAVLQLLERHHLSDHLSFSGLFEELNRLIKVKKIIIFIDEFDGIPISQLEEFLTVLRDLYQDYKSI